MASEVATDKIACKALFEMWDHDPNSTAAKVVTPDASTTERWVDMKSYHNFAVGAMSSTLTGNGITLLEIVAADTALQSDTSLTVIKTSGTVACDAVGDWAFLECNAEEIAHLASTYDLRYITARITLANAADEAVVVFYAEAKNPHDAVTAASTIA